jgi:multidrug efflux pump subunit AcrB
MESGFSSRNRIGNTRTSRRGITGIPWLVNMNPWANQGSSWINLEFGLETDMQKTLIDVISRLNRIPPLPRDALSPTNKG